MKYVLAVGMSVMVVLACTAKRQAVVKATGAPVAVHESMSTVVPTAVPVDAEAMSDVAVLVAYYEARPSLGTDPELVRVVALDTVRFAQLLKFDNDSIRDMLALWHVESRYHQNTKGTDGKSWGITQVRIRRIAELTDAWKSYGWTEDNLGSIYDPTRQVAMGVWAYKVAFEEGKGDRFGALRRYNGGNRGKRSKAYKMAHAHAMRVVKARKAIFGE